MPGPVFADGVGHDAEGAYGRRLHDDGDDAEEGAAEIIDERAHHMPALAQHHQRETEQDGDEQHLQDVALGECADHRVGNDMEDELDRRLVRGARGVIGDRVRVARATEAVAWAREVADQEADGQRKGRDDLEIDERLDADPADLARILDVRDTRHDRAEDDRRDGHLDQLDEAVAQRLHPRALGDIRRHPADQEAEDDGDQHLHIQQLVEGFACRPVNARELHGSPQDSSDLNHMIGQSNCGNHYRAPPSLSGRLSADFRSPACDASSPLRRSVSTLRRKR